MSLAVLRRNCRAPVRLIDKQARRFGENPTSQPEKQPLLAYFTLAEAQPWKRCLRVDVAAFCNLTS
jgi:hypothetical protein